MRNPRLKLFVAFKNAWDELAGIRLFMQPVQDLSVETRISRTQFQYTLETPDVQELDEWTTRLVTRLQAVPELRERGQRSTIARPASQRSYRIATRRRGLASLRRSSTMRFTTRSVNAR